ncbi:M48 family metalloprotease [Maritimibacter alkaliphilus]|uniref:M48 family metalloprotease n=1 Tax=Maritimibacter alkaliphilus TaxID=404236 RepID=UPI001C9628A9|nr:M48 family metalloprotease [Maritimibacter alkaliphilus]MBY6091236.1 M48 family metalloprotease [Maritimibacter alkaliphilus]
MTALRLLLVALFLPLLAACDVTTTGPVTVTPGASAPRSQPRDQAALQAQARQAVNQFVMVADRLEPVMERECRRRAPELNCNFQIVVDRSLTDPPNAFQTLDDTGHPILAVNIALIASVENADEMAFVMSHEAAHHISDHLGQQQANAMAGAQVLGGLAAAGGASGSGLEMAQQLGAALGARRYSQDYELQADALGAIIARAAGFDALHGAEYFNRIPDPGNSFLGTHPPNARRLETVRYALANGV